MANQWFRLWHDMPTDPKFRTISKISKQPLSEVLATYLIIMNSASCSEERGCYEIEEEDIAALLDVEEQKTKSILDAMQGRVLNGKRLTGWDKRQPAKEDGAINGRHNSSNYVYYVVDGITNLVKIGISKNPWSRIKDLSTGNSSELKILATLKVSCRSEFFIHKFFSKTRGSGEWFSPSKALFLLIENTNNKKIKDEKECEDFLNSLPIDLFEMDFDTSNFTTVANSSTTKDKEEDKDKDLNKKINKKENSAPPDTPPAAPRSRKLKNDPRHEEFYKLYPVHRGKEPSAKAFCKRNFSDEEFAKVMAALKRQIEVFYANEKSGKFQPEWKYPASWLNAAAWDDEVSVAGVISISETPEHRLAKEKSKQESERKRLEEEESETFRLKQKYPDLFDFGKSGLAFSRAFSKAREMERGLA